MSECECGVSVCVCVREREREKERERGDPGLFLPDHPLRPTNVFLQD